jgi:nicotinamide mononucleotide transporter
MFLQARKKLECWIYWIIADFICIPFYIWQHLYFTAIQYLVFTIIAVFAFFEWQGKYNKSIGKL